MATSEDRAAPEYFAPPEAEEYKPLYGGDPEPEPTERDPGARTQSHHAFGADLASLVLRVAVAALLLVRGTQELFGWFGGQGGAPLAATLQTLGYQHFSTGATAVSIAEVVIAVLLIVGLLTEWACGGAQKPLLTALSALVVGAVLGILLIQPQLA